MKVLLTGHRGRLGPSIRQALVDAGHEVRGFDRADGDDVLDAAAVADAVKGVDAVVHVAGLAGDRAADPADIMRVNLIGTSNILLAAEAAGVRRVIHVSSGRALGVLERDPDYLPLDDAHRGLPSHPYALAKWLSEEMCLAVTNRSGMETICLRPVAVFGPEDYERALSAPEADPAPDRLWPLGVHLDVRDMASAAAAAIDCPPVTHERILLCAADISGSKATRDQIAAHVPRIPWRGGSDYFDADAYRSLVDLRKARALLGWEPRHRWPGRPAG